MTSEVEELRHGAALSGMSIRQMIEFSPSLVEGCRDLDRQIQPNGIDLTLQSVWRPEGPGQLGIEDAERLLPPRTEVVPSDSHYTLAAGPYVVVFNEIVNLPNNLMALGRPRSSLSRSGVSLHTSVWDAGYRGRSEALMVVYNPAGFRVRRGSRILQLVFLRLDGAAEGYRGAYQHENLRDPR